MAPAPVADATSRAPLEDASARAPVADPSTQAPLDDPLAPPASQESRCSALESGDLVQSTTRHAFTSVADIDGDGWHVQTVILSRKPSFEELELLAADSAGVVTVQLALAGVEIEGPGVIPIVITAKYYESNGVHSARIIAGRESGA